MCDLYRLGAPKLYKLRAAFTFPPEESTFLRHLQWTLFDHARSLASIVQDVAHYGTAIMADSWLPTMTYDSCRIMLYYLTQLIEPFEDSSKQLILQTMPLLQRSLHNLWEMQALHAVAEPLVLTYNQLLTFPADVLIQYAVAQTMIGKMRLGVDNSKRDDIIPDDPYRPNPEDAPAYVFPVP